MIERKEYLTREKYDELTEELAFLKNTRRNEIARTLEHARSLGDLSENAEYHEAREEQRALEGRIFQLEELLKNAEVIKPHHSTVVEVGSTVILQKKGGETAKTFTLVGSEEADTGAGRISHQSPLGAAMLGKKEGENFTFVTPVGKKFNYTIKKIA